MIPARALIPYHRAALSALFLLTGCASYAPLPLDTHAAPKDSVAQLRHDGMALPDRLGLGDITALVLENNPELLAARSQRGIAQAQMLAAGIPPNPSLSASYGFLLGGPGTIASFTAGLTQDIKSLVTLSARHDAARQAARSIDAALLWQEWQTVGKARLLTVDLVEGARLQALLQQQDALLQDRLDRAEKALGNGDTTLSTVAPDLAAVADLRKQLGDLTRQNLTRKRDLAALLGLSPQAPLPLSDALDLPPVNDDEVRRMLPDLANRRPDLVALQLGYRSQEEKLRAAVLAQFPALAIGVSGGSDTSDIRTLGPQITMDLPLFDRNQGNIALERATRQQLHDEFSARLAGARSEVLALLADMGLLRQQLASRQAQLVALTPTAQRAEAAYRAGDLDERGYVDLLTTYGARQQDLVTIRQSLLEQQVALATLIGAGLPSVSSIAAEVRP